MTAASSRLGDLVAALPLTPVPDNPPGWEDLTVHGVRSDNRRVGGGELFAGHGGAHVHGARYARDAVGAGATAVLTDPAGAELLAREGSLGVPVLVAEDVPALLGELAAAVYGRPAEALGTFAVTGTNGKTSTVYMLDHALRSLGRTTGLIGTVEVRVAGRSEPAVLTTPQPADLQALLADMVATGVTDMSMEVSSHALGLRRVDPVVFDVAGFTNLSQDHLDYHGTLEQYFAAKASLFAPARSRRGVVVVDDSWGRRLAETAAAERPGAVASLSVQGHDADWRVTEITGEGQGHTFTLIHRDGRRLRTGTGLPGGFNVTNAALAAAMVLTSGVEPDRLEASLAAAGGLTPVIPGRMEQLADFPRVIVDFAHNPGALQQAVDALRATTAGRLVLVFGATGSRDRGKRPQMAQVAVDGADAVVIADDDPHDESPDQIRAELLAAADAHRPGSQVREIGNRAEAIRTAVLEAAEEDTVLVAGRGHEKIQEVAGVDHHLDDREEVRAALALRPGRAGGSAR
ncbi:UDP-N-acetylmuramoyl-L-alanyl-D-glutamate--2,6-diaminopimelate ligase [Georgenia halophila]|uniref:UDP-N-acetylmuramyl-tripeptide synthetase n=1 Tax=Georgenia halophila TaxID=620889 RepID=A0ABP8L7V5_9MICO